VSQAASRVHDLGADRIAELLAELFGVPGQKGHLRTDNDQYPITMPRALVREDFEDHVRGRARLGAMPFIDAGNVRWACIDIDSRKWGYDDDFDPEVIGIVDAIMAELGAHRMRGALERSKSKGWHVWVNFDEPVEAARVRAFLRKVALGAGAHDETDLVCPRQDERPEAGNGMWLPLAGMSREPFTRFYELDADTGDWLPAENQAAVVRALIDQPTARALVPGVDAEPATPESAANAHSCQWILDELGEIGIRLEGVIVLRGPKAEHERLNFACPFHEAKRKQSRGGSGVMWVDGHGHCSSAMCDRSWRSLREFVDMLGGPVVRATAPLLTAAEFANDQPPESIVERLIYRGSLHNFTGGSKSGKSFATSQMTMCVSNGHPFLGLEVARTPVLYVGLEMTAGILRQRMEAIHRDTDVPMPVIGRDLHVIANTRERSASLNLTTTQGRDELRERIDQTRAGLVVLDTLYRFHPGVDPSDNAAMGLLFGDLLELARASGAALWVLDHIRKGEVGGPVSHSAIGAATKGGAANVIVSLKRTKSAEGFSWEMDVESHFGSWDDPITYRRPARTDGTPGAGCQLCSAAQSRGLDESAVCRLFEQYGTIDPTTGRKGFESQRAMIAALEAAGFAGEGSRSDGQELARRIEREYSAPSDSVRTATREAALIWTYPGSRGARRFVLRATGPTGPERTN
jgi:AAA domain/TOTE conflict system, Archaeo-Eukaryotic Primase domain